MHIDHVIIGAPDTAEVRDLLRSAYGFGIVDGSPNPDGTASWVVPFDSPDVQYLEVLVPHDEAVLAGDEAFGRTFLELVANGATFLNWAVLTDDIDRDAARIAELTGDDPELLRGESVRADGQQVPWAEAAFMASWRQPSRPFFLSYGNWPARRQRLPGDLRDAAHDRTPRAIDRLRIRTSDPRLEQWIGTALPLELTSGDDAVESVTIVCDDGPVEVDLR